MISSNWILAFLICFIFSSCKVLYKCESVSADDRLVVTSSIQLEKGKVYAGLIMEASNVVIDGQGAIIQGDMTVAPSGRQGTGIYAKGRSHVTLKNVRVQGFRIGIHIEDGQHWLLENCDVSDNYHDPDFKWGEGPPQGGFVLARVRDSRLLRCVANRNWNNCDLFDSHNNAIENCDFSTASNVCLRLRYSTKNQIVNNDLSRGLRIRAGEVHARDSTCVLIEADCRENRLIRNNCKYGGDGIFIRSNGSTMSTDNWIEENDCSFSNNNGIECGSPGNVFVRNRANHCSYGFWLGGADRTRLIENEACFNGLLSGFHQSPHLPDGHHAGIVFMFGSANNIDIRGNRCIGNRGAGIALQALHKEEHKFVKPFNVTIEQNFLVENEWGLYLEKARYVQFRRNECRYNRSGDLFDVGGNEHISVGENSPLPSVSSMKPFDNLVLEGPESVVEDSVANFTFADLTTGQEQTGMTRWYFDNDEVSHDQMLTYRFTNPGAFFLSTRAEVEGISRVAWKPIYVLDRIDAELATESPATDWAVEAEPDLEIQVIEDRNKKLIGEHAILFDIIQNHGRRARVRYPSSGHLNLSLGEKSKLIGWIRGRTPVSLGFQDFNPEITLHDAQGNQARYLPKEEKMSLFPNQPNRSEWIRIEIDLAKPSEWTRSGDSLKDIHHLTFGFDTWENLPFQVWIDGLSISSN